MINDLANIGDESICPVCGAIFTITEEHCYFISGGRSCNWKCFISEVKRRDEEKNTQRKEKKNGH